MTSEIHLSHVQDELRGRPYPAAREELVESCGGTTVLFADGDADLGALQNVLPIEALGEPGQSDGDA